MEWESLIVCNPGVWYENDTFFMLYRAAGNDVEHVIRFGLAVSKNGYDFKRVSERPWFLYPVVTDRIRERGGSPDC